jgi:hypothetical protein
VDTDHAKRYLAQLCRHFSNLRRHESRRGADQALARPDVEAQVEWSDTEGTVRFPWGRCIMRADSHALTLRTEAEDYDNLQRVQAVVGEHVERFGKRDGLKVNWQPE